MRSRPCLLGLKEIERHKVLKENWQFSFHEQIKPKGAAREEFEKISPGMIPAYFLIFAGSFPTMKKFLKKNWSNLLFILFIVLLLIPQTRKPIQVTLNRLISFSPSEIAEDKRERLESYQWTLQDLQGKRFSFEQAKAEVVVLNFWATWCPPCIAEMPSFQKLYNDYGERVSFYFVSSEDQDVLQRFLQKHDYELPVYQPFSAPPEQLQDRSLPTTFVISRTGELVVKKTGSANWNATGFRELLDSLLEQELVHSGIENWK